MALDAGGIAAIQASLKELRAKRDKLLPERDVRTDIIARLQAEKAVYVADIQAINAQIAALKSNLPEVPDEG
jgi:cell division protein FtsB